MILSMQDKLESQGILMCKSRVPRTCQLCWGHSSNHRRKCPVCEMLIAPGCWPRRCWSDELNHCKDCHTLIEILKHHRFKIQYRNYKSGMGKLENRSNPKSYMNFPIGVHINIMLFIFQIKDFVWSEFHLNKLMHVPTCGCP